MNTIKNLMIAFVAIATLTACSNDDDNNEPAFLLSNTNLAGSHDLTFLRVDAEVRDQVAGATVVVDITGVGDTFQTTIDFSANGTFVVDGEFRVVTEVSVNGQPNDDPDPVIVDLNNEEGTYSIGSDAQTITFSGIQPIPFDENINIDLIDGTWDVTLFNENELRLTKTESEVDGDTETDSTIEIRFVRQ